MNHQQVRLLVCNNSGITNRIITDQSNTMGGGGGAEGNRGGLPSLIC